jgi:gas vesicle protein
MDIKWSREMKNHEDVPYIVIDRDSGAGVGSFVLGALVGAGLALLFAPQSGKETQEEIRTQAKKLRVAAGDRLVDAQRGIEDRLESVRDEMQSRVEMVKDAVDSGRDAARSARTDLEGKLEKSKAAYRAGIAAARDAAEGDPEEEAEESA